MADVEFRVLGRVEVLRSGKEVSVGRSSTLNLLAGLLVSANTAVSREALAELAWGDMLPVNPRASVHTKVGRLRRLLGDGVIETVGDAYRLRSDEGQLDVLRFESLISQAMAAGGDEEEAAARLGEAIGLWRGDPLSNVDSPALNGEAAARLTERYFLACERWAEVSLRLGRARDVVQRMAPLVEAQPQREPMVRLLMLGLQHDGRHSEALTAYELLRRQLREDIGADPGPALQELHMAILRGAPPESGPAHQRWSGARPAPGGLIGRDRDVIEVARTLDQHPAVTVTGPAGVGKTALALQVATHFAEQSQADVTVAEMGTLPAYQGSDPCPIAGLLLAILRVPTTAEMHAEDVLLEALRGSTELIVLDNAEHLVNAAARLADVITRRCPSVKIIITSRRPLGHSTEKIVEIAPLSPADTALLLRRRMADYGAGGSADDVSVSELCPLIEGLPLAAELTAARLRTMSPRTLLDRIGTHPDLLASAGRPGLAHQQGLAATLQWSYNLLPVDQRFLLGRLGVIAGTFSLRDAEQIGGYDPIAEEDVAVLLSELADNSLVQVRRHEQEYSYRLLWLIREFAVGQARPGELDSARRRHLDWLATTVGQISGADDDQRDRLIITALDRFGEILQALDWGLRPGASPGDLESGVRLLLAAQPVWERRPGALRLVLAHASQVLADAGIDLPAHLAADLTAMAGYLHFRTGNVPAARPLLESARSATDHASPAGRKRQAHALALLSIIAAARLEPRAADIARESCEAARQSGDRAAIVSRLSLAAEILALLGRLEEAAKLIGEAEQAIGTARRLRLAFLVRRAQVFVRAHDAVTALKDSDEILAARTEITMYDQAAALRTRGIAQTLSGQPENALATLAEAKRLAREAQAALLLPELAEALGHAEYRAGNLHTAIEHVRDGLTWTLANDDFLDAMGLLHLAVALSAKSGSPDTAPLAALVRSCRVGGRLPTWPFPESEYARVEQALGLADDPIRAEPVQLASITQAGQLALKQLDRPLSWIPGI
ncbi:MAG TPA: BTAD domain-containing putative transcriptional regulator [Trebonia sp.]|jgi:DNA-binding SARP family transcriptional activator/predicted ATPase|nr:BTAD domain-containing putative transcriptional regulator [Trebonia sp.]